MLDLMLVYLPAILAFFGSIVVLWLIHWLLLGRHESLGAQARLPRQLSLFALTNMALLLVIVLFPMTDSTRGQIITLLGIVITGVIALSSTSFVANVMAGLMLQVVKSFNPGDFIRVGTYFGRVTERGLFHVEIQTEDRDLATLPNLHLATNPVTVVHKTGTIISTELSLGYDISHELIEDLLKEAAKQAELQDPFVLFISLDDFSIVYRISGSLLEVKNLITAKSNLKKCVLDVLHANNVEIVSPHFMNQRQMPQGSKSIPEELHIPEEKPSVIETKPEDIIFDKAEVAAASEVLRTELDQLAEKSQVLTKSKKGLSKEEQEGIDLQIQTIEEKKHLLSNQLEKKVDSDD